MRLLAETHHGAAVMDKPFAITLDVGSQPRQQDRLAGAPSAPSTSTACRPATTPARPARTSRAGSTTPRRAARATSGPGGSSWRTTRSRRSWAGSATTRARPPATAASSTRRSGSTRSSASSATRRSRAAGRVDPRRSRTRQAGARRRRRALRPLAPPTTCPARPRGHDPRGGPDGRRDDALRHPPLPAAARGARRRDRADPRPRASSSS